MQLARPTLQQGDQRSGATLTEVLMSLLIFSVGITSVFALFPVSLVSSLRATQLTNGKILADNARQLVKSNPELVINHLAVAPNPARRIQFWQPNMTVAAGQDYVVPQLQPGHILPTIWWEYQCQTPGTTGVLEPDWPKFAGATVNDGTAQWFVAIRQPYVVDPLGFLEGTLNSTQVGYDFLGDGYGNIARTNPGYASYTSALSDFALPDTWTVQFEAIPTSVNIAAPPGIPAGTAQIAFPATNVLPLLTNDAFTRVILSDADGRRFHSMSLDSPITNSPVIVQDTDPTSIPAEILASPGPVRIETLESRYTYFLTVRPQFNRPPIVSVVVMFNRGYSLDEERLFPAVPGTGIDQIVLDLSVASSPAPLIREGNYLFHTNQCQWYRIVDVSPDPFTISSTVTVTVDRPLENFPNDVSNPGQPNGTQRVIFLPGIVEIYEL